MLLNPVGCVSVLLLSRSNYPFNGNLELLITTPVRSVELMLAKVLPYVFIGLIQVTLVLVLGVLLFDVPLRGELNCRRDDRRGPAVQ